MARALQLIAGPHAREHLLQYGLRQQDVNIMAGASGGPKWLALAALDQYLVSEFFRGRQTPLHLIGSSSGAWRFTCFARRDPAAASKAFAHAYQHICYPRGIDSTEVTRLSQQLLDAVLPDKQAEQEVLGNPYFKLNVIVARAQGLAAVRQKKLLALSLATTALANAISRKNLQWFFHRVRFHVADSTNVFTAFNDIPTEHIALNSDNLRATVMASGSIPLILDAVKDIPGARRGFYYDGGVIDYHFDIPFSHQGLVLYPHFYSHITPGWFDKGLRWRRANPDHYSNVIIVCPSDEWLAALPSGRIPDRKDFHRISDNTRISAWGEVIKRSEMLADDFEKLVSGGPGRISEYLVKK